MVGGLLMHALQVAGGRWYTGLVKKTSIYIEPDVDVALARRAAAEGTTKAELIRQALRDAASGSMRVKPRARGVFTGAADLGSRTDEHLTQSGFGEQ
jgi:Ribbon-helix-helix protein, copG family